MCNVTDTYIQASVKWTGGQKKVGQTSILHYIYKSSLGQSIHAQLRQVMTSIFIIWCDLLTISYALQQQHYSTMYYSPLCHSVCKSLSYAHLEPTNFTALPAPSTGGSLVWNGIPPIPPQLQWAPKAETSSCGITMCWIRELSYRGWDEAGLWREEYTVQTKKVFGHSITPFLVWCFSNSMTFIHQVSLKCPNTFWGPGEIKLLWNLYCVPHSYKSLQINV